MLDAHSFLTGIFASLGGTALLAVLFKTFLTRGIESRFNIDEMRKEIVGSAQIEHRRTQLAEFYGPLYAYLKSSEKIYDLWTKEKKLGGINDEIKARFREANNDMMHLIRTKIHLIDEAEFPPEMMNFVCSVAIWNMYTSKQDGLPEDIARLPGVEFPIAFRDYTPLNSSSTK
jgi:hypothetical protein